MPRINLEDQLFNDGRLHALNKIVGDDFKAMGMFVYALKLGQTYFLKGEYIPKEVFMASGMDALIKADLAKVEETGIYVCGVKNHFSWIEQRKEAGKVSGEKRRVKRDKNNENEISLNENEISLNEKGTKPDSRWDFHERNTKKNEPQSQSQSQSQSQINNIIHYPIESDREPTKDKTYNLTESIKELQIKHAPATEIILDDPPKEITDTEKRVCAEVKQIYMKAFRNRYGIDPVMSAAEHTNIRRLVRAIGGAKAKWIAEKYLDYPEPYHVRQKHPINLLLKDITKVLVEINSPARMMDEMHVKKQMGTLIDEIQKDDRRKKLEQAIADEKKGIEHDA